MLMRTNGNVKEWKRERPKETLLFPSHEVNVTMNVGYVWRTRKKKKKSWSVKKISHKPMLTLFRELCSGWECCWEGEKKRGKKSRETTVVNIKKEERNGKKIQLKRHDLYFVSWNIYQFSSFVSSHVALVEMASLFSLHRTYKRLNLFFHLKWHHVFLSMQIISVHPSFLSL